MTHRVLTAHVPAALAREVDALAQQLDRPRGWIVAEALSLFVGLERSRHELTVEALAEVDQGRTIPHADVEAWARSLSPSAKKPKPARRRRR